MPSMIGRNNNNVGVFELSSSLSLSQKMFQPNLMEAGQLHHHQLLPLDMTQNNNTSESDVQRIREDEFFDSATKSGNSENQEAANSGGEDQEPRAKKKRYHRHTQHQIQEMEANFFLLKNAEGLRENDVCFCFQTQQERHENTALRTENEKLRADNMRFREALSNASCPNCGGPTAIGEMSFDEHHLRLENARLREEIDRISAIAAKYVGKPVVSYPLLSPSSGTPRPLELGIGGFGGQPGLSGGDMYGAGDLLRSISGPTEADKPMIIELAVAAMEELIGMAQMGDPLWLTTLEVFSGIVSRGMTLEVLSTGVAGNYNGALQVVIWVEHVEVDERGVHNLYKQLVSSGHAFGAKRWIATLDRQCERLASAMATNIPTVDVGVITNQDGRKSMLKLAERMCISFCAGVSASTAHTWTTLSGTGADDVRVMTRKSVDDPGRPAGIVLSAATSFWLPVSPKRVFEFLRDENSRNEWDILSNGGVVQEMAHIANGRDTGNCVSLLRVNSANSSQSNMLILQESCTDTTGSFVIYAPVDIVAMNVVLNGGDPDYVALLPSGFAILPDGTTNGGNGGGESGHGGGGSLLTVAFQILVDSVPTAKLSLGSVATVNNLIACTVERIKASLSGEVA
ncbi:hypothetical protein RYX36_010452 [Vicia faba]